MTETLLLAKGMTPKMPDVPYLHLMCKDRNGDVNGDIMAAVVNRWPELKPHADRLLVETMNRTGF